MDASTFELPGASHGAYGHYVDGMREIHIYNIYTDGFDVQYDTIISGARHTYFNRLFPEYLQSRGHLLNALLKEREKAKYHFETLANPENPSYFNAWKPGVVMNCLMKCPERVG